MTTIQVPESVVSDTALRQLCEEGILGMPHAHGYGGHKGTSAGKTLPCKRPHVDLELSVKNEASELLARKKAKSEEVLPNKAPEVPAQPLPALCDDDHDDTDKDPIVSRASALKDERVNKKEIKRREARAKEILKMAGLCFNTDFQTAHKGTSVAGKGSHWKAFLAGLTSKGDIECHICLDLMEKFSVFKELERTTPPKKRKECQLVVCAPSAPDELQSPPKKRGRAGRPKKSEVDEQTFNLLEYLESRRHGQYYFLTRQEANERQKSGPKASAQKFNLDEEMSKRPAQCKLCGIFLHFPVITNSRALSLGHHLEKFLCYLMYSGPFTVSICIGKMKEYTVQTI